MATGGGGGGGGGGLYKLQFARPKTNLEIHFKVTVQSISEKNILNQRK